MISWGILAIMMAFVKTAPQFYTVRFLLGAAEAGFFRASSSTSAHWFRYQDRAEAVALFMAAIPISNLIGSPISGLLLGVHWLDQPGWRWLFIVGRHSAVILGFTTLFYLTDWPREAKWLPEDEKQWIIRELETEKRERKAVHQISMWQALRHRDVLLLVGTYFFATVGFYGLNIWLPTILKERIGLERPEGDDGRDDSAPGRPGGNAAHRRLVRIARASGRWHAAGAILLGAIGYLLVISRGEPWLVVAAFCIVAAGADGYFPGFWPLPTGVPDRVAAAAAAIGLINSVGNLGGFVGPYILG